MKAITHTKIFVVPLQFDISNRATIATKKTRPVFVERTDPDTPPVITDHVRELASLMRNNNSLVRNSEDYTKRRETWYLSTLADLNISGDKYRSISISKADIRPVYMFKGSCTEGITANIDGNEKFHMVIDGHTQKLAISGFYLREHAPAIDNVNTIDKPTFRHDSLYLFDKLSEDYCA